MEMIDRVVTGLEKNRERRLNGDLIAIPWSTLPRLNDALPGVEQGKYYIMAARPKVGKTQITDYMFMYEVVDWYVKNKNNTSILPKIDYWSHEMSSNAKELAAVSYKLFKSYGIIISPQTLNSKFKKYILGQDILDIIKSYEFRQWSKEFEQIVSFHNNIRNPYGIFKYLKNEKDSTGHWTEKIIPWQNEDGSITDKRVKDKYIANNPDLYHISINDHVGLFSAERGTTLYDTIQKHSAEYNIDLRDNYNMIPVDIQQMAATSAMAEYTSNGRIIVDKLKPTDSDLSDNKHTSMNVNVMMSLFWPAKHNIAEYEGWDLARLGNNHRELIINLNRDGMCNASIQLGFLGACNYFAELPRVPDARVYQQMQEYNKKTIGHES
jgi:hypothetical protein